MLTSLGSKHHIYPVKTVISQHLHNIAANVITKFTPKLMEKHTRKKKELYRPVKTGLMYGI